MKSLSQKIVLVSLLLQLCLDVQQVVYAQPAQELEFGDMLEFSNCGGLYSHYAIYVDNVTINGREDGNNIFEMTKNPSGCRFSTLTRNVRRTNHLDTNINRQDEQAIIDAIQNLMNSEDCEEWSLTNNCEIIATHVRYGAANAQCNQEGTIAGPFCRFLTYYRNRTQRQRKESENLYQSESAAAA